MIWWLAGTYRMRWSSKEETEKKSADKKSNRKKKLICQEKKSHIKQAQTSADRPEESEISEASRNRSSSSELGKKSWGNTLTYQSPETGKERSSIADRARTGVFWWWWRIRTQIDLLPLLHLPLSSPSLITMTMYVQTRLRYYYLSLFPCPKKIKKVFLKMGKIKIFFNNIHRSNE